MRRIEENILRRPSERLGDMPAAGPQERPVWIIDVDRDMVAWANPSAVARSSADSLMELISAPFTDVATAREPLATWREKLRLAEQRVATAVLRGSAVFGETPLDADLRLHRLRDGRLGLRISERRAEDDAAPEAAAPSLVAMIGAGLAGVGACLMTVGPDGLIRTASRASDAVLGAPAVDLIGRPLPHLFDAVGRRKLGLFLERGPTLSGFRFDQGIALRLAPGPMGDATDVRVTIVGEIVGQGGEADAGSARRRPLARQQSGGERGSLIVVMSRSAALGAAPSEPPASGQESVSEERVGQEQFGPSIDGGAPVAGSDPRLAPEMAPAMAHAIRTPLTSIIGFAEQAKRSVGSEDRAVLDPIDAVLAAGAEMTALLDGRAAPTEDLAAEVAPGDAAARATEPVAEPVGRRNARAWVDPSAVAADIVAALTPTAAAAGVRIVTDFAAAPARVVAAAAPMRQTLEALLTQAIFAAGAGGRVLFHTADWDPDGVAIEIVDNSEGWTGLDCDLDHEKRDEANAAAQSETVRRARAEMQSEGAIFEFENRPGAGATSRIVFRADRVVSAPRNR